MCKTPVNQLPVLEEGILIFAQNNNSGTNKPVEHKGNSHPVRATIYDCIFNYIL